ncbi:MAG: hypothetical protein AAF528_00090 [Cyanobacteria bacterium P01_C01_bin.121]
MQCIFVENPKGGSGKSFLTTTLAQLFIDRSVSFVCYDCDRANPDTYRKLHSVLPVRLAIFSESEKLEDAANNIYLSAVKHRALVNLPAQAPLRQWFEANDIFTIAPDDKVEFVFIFVTTSGYDSLSLLKRHLEYFQDRVTTIVAKNHGTGGDEWEAFEDPSLQAFINKFNVLTIDFPRFTGSTTRNRLDQLSLSFGEGLASPNFNSLEKQRIRKFLKAAYAAFDSTGVF